MKHTNRTIVRVSSLDPTNGSRPISGTTQGVTNYDVITVVEALMRMRQTLTAIQEELRVFKGAFAERNLREISNDLPSGVKVDLSPTVRKFERLLIETALDWTHGHQRNAAKLLTLKPKTLSAKIKKLGIQR